MSDIERGTPFALDLPDIYGFGVIEADLGDKVFVRMQSGLTGTMTHNAVKQAIAYLYQHATEIGTENSEALLR